MNCADGTIANVGDIVIRKSGGYHHYNAYGVVVKYLPKTDRYRVIYTHVDTVYDRSHDGPVVYSTETPTKQYGGHGPGILVDNQGYHKHEGYFYKWNGKPVISVYRGGGI